MRLSLQTVIGRRQVLGKPPTQVQQRRRYVTPRGSKLPTKPFVGIAKPKPGFLLHNKNPQPPVGFTNRIKVR